MDKQDKFAKFIVSLCKSTNGFRYGLSV